jgi:hypothetical protein
VPDRSLVLTVGVRRSIKIWDLESKNIVDELKPDDVPPSSKKSLPVRLPSYPPPPTPPDRYTQAHVQGCFTSPDCEAALGVSLGVEIVTQPWSTLSCSLARLTWLDGRPRACRPGLLDPLPLSRLSRSIASKVGRRCGIKGSARRPLA